MLLELFNVALSAAFGVTVGHEPSDRLLLVPGQVLILLTESPDQLLQGFAVRWMILDLNHVTIWMEEV